MVTSTNNAAHSENQSLRVGINWGAKNHTVLHARWYNEWLKRRSMIEKEKVVIYPPGIHEQFIPQGYHTRTIVYFVCDVALFMHACGCRSPSRY